MAEEQANAAGEPNPPSAVETYRAALQRGSDWERQVEAYVREKPIQSVLLAAAVGFVLSVLWPRH